MAWAILWTWIHLLQFNVSNQTLNIEEDAVNKGYRPLPSGRISLHAARLLRWVLVPSCWALSFHMNPEAFRSSLLLTFLVIVHNELGGHAKSWVFRNILNGMGIASFEMGATSIIRKVTPFTGVL